MKHLIILILIFTSTGLFGESSYDEGMYLFNAGFYEEALGKLKKDKVPFVKGIAYFRTGKHEAALTQFKGVDLKKYPFLTSEVQYYLGATYYKLERYSDGIAALKQTAKDFTLKKERDLMMINSYLKLKQYDQIKPFYTRYKDLKILGSTNMAIKVALGAYLLRQGGKQNRKEAMGYFRGIEIKYPGWKMMKRIKALRVGYKLYYTLNQREQVDKCAYLTKLHRNKAANSCFDAFIEGLEPKGRWKRNNYCKAHFYQGLALKKRRKHTKALGHFKKVMSRCKSFKEGDRLYYHAANSARAKRSYGLAIKYFYRLYTRYPKSKLADDGINGVGFIYSALKRYKKAEETYLKQMKLFKNGDTTEEAAWKVAYNLFKQKKYKQYIAWYKKVAEAGIKEKKYHSRGRLKYWLARSYGKLKQRQKAQKLYLEVIQTQHNNFYAYLARMKYTGKIPQKAVTPIPAPKTDQLIAYFKKQGSWEKINFYLTHHLNQFLIYEINKLNKKNELIKQFRDELLVFLIDGKVYHVPFWYPRGSYKWIAYNRSLEKYQELFKYLYPKAYEGYVTQYGKRPRITEEIIWSIMREESYFHVSIESWANAYGLMQIIQSTAKNLARILKVKFQLKKLYHPEYNIKLGSKYLSMNSRLFPGRIDQLIASYNAGENAVKRWRKKRGKLPIDQFIEEIPYNETRHYVKRVLTTYFIYNLLYQNRFINIFPKETSQKRLQKR